MFLFGHIWYWFFLLPPPDNPRERETMDIIQNGLEGAIQEYLSGGVSRFIQHRERIQSYLTTRDLPGTSTAASNIPPQMASAKVRGRFV